MSKEIVGMILAAGKGSRLKDLGLEKPKALLKLRDGTFLEYILKKFKKLGIKKVIINLHHLGNKIEEYLKENNNFDMEILFSKEEILLGTGGALKKAYPLFSEAKTLLLHNCDIYTEFDIENLKKEHFSNANDVTLAVQKRDSRRYLAFNSRMNLIGWKDNLSNHEQFISDVSYSLYGFSCMHLISQRILEFISKYPDENFSIIKAYLGALKGGVKISGYDIKSSYWVDVGTQEKLKKLRDELSERKRLS